MTDKDRAVNAALRWQTRAENAEAALLQARADAQAAVALVAELRADSARLAAQVAELRSAAHGREMEWATIRDEIVAERDDLRARLAETEGQVGAQQ